MTQGGAEALHNGAITMAWPCPALAPLTSQLAGASSSAYLRPKPARPQGRFHSSEHLKGQCPPVRGSHVPSSSHTNLHPVPFRQSFKNVLIEANFVLSFFLGGVGSGGDSTT